MTLWELEFIYGQMRRHGYLPPMLDVGGVFSTTLADYGKEVVKTTSGHIWSEIDLECELTHDVERHDPGYEYNTIVSTSTLEHCTNPFGFMDRIGKLLAPGGLLILTTPFMWPRHGDPEHDRWRFSDSGLRLLVDEDRNGLQVIESGVHAIVDYREMSYMIASRGPLSSGRKEMSSLPPVV